MPVCGTEEMAQQVKGLLSKYEDLKGQLDHLPRNQPLHTSQGPTTSKLSQLNLNSRN